MENLLTYVACLAAVVVVVVFYLEGTRVSTLAPVKEKLPAFYYDTLSDLRSVVDDLTKIKSISSAWEREYYTAQSSQRVKQLQHTRYIGNFDVLYNVIVPEAHCPNLVRVGYVVDGGKYVCNPLLIPKDKCRIYSLGLANEISFDREIQKITNNSCKIYGYDRDLQREDVVAEYKSMNGNIGAVNIANLNGSTIEDLFEANNDSFADILKVDIEGSEHSTLIPFLSNGKYKVCQLLVEIHGAAHDHLRLLVSIAK